MHAQRAFVPAVNRCHAVLAAWQVRVIPTCWISCFVERRFAHCGAPGTTAARTAAIGYGSWTVQVCGSPWLWIITMASVQSCGLGIFTSAPS